MSQPFTISEDEDVDPPLNASDPPNHPNSEAVDPLNHHNSEAVDSKSDDQVVAGAAVAGAAVGVLVGGPLIGLVGAGAAAYAATCENQVGDVARSAGTTTVAMGKRLAKHDKVF
uniref:Uncharacterized protein n=1 Tax=Cryptomonas curvata TaxID=233186 RepID=A0A7S0QHA4_9CRYP|mmetsp:Transcript_28424/g.59432  ORF Transcript_28424/g.59432 Transcript_28424/m.59432 type:complete len:114 (+) Transcript_28424:37-378(+)